MGICNDIIWYNSVNLISNDNYSKYVNSLPGYNTYIKFHDMFAYNLGVIDRYDIITLPIKTYTLDISKPPQFKYFSKTYEEICLERAKQILDYVKEHNKKIFLMYSGGIDSTTVICSFMMICSDEELKKYFIIGISETGIIENKKFFNEFIVKKFTLVPSYLFQYYLGDDNYYFLTGECNDQIFGQDVFQGFMNLFGDDIINQPCNETNIIKCFNSRLNNLEISEKFMHIFNKIKDKAPINIDTIYDYFWWANFDLKWQNVIVRLASYSKKLVKIEENYTAFFATSDFQLWALNNQDKKIKNTWESYKFTCKDLIYKLNKDEDYRKNKRKAGSGSKLLSCKINSNIVNKNFECISTPITKIAWNLTNDFI